MQRHAQGLKLFVKKMLNSTEYEMYYPIVSRVGSVPEFLSKPLATCFFQGLGGGGSGPPVTPSGSALDLSAINIWLPKLSVIRLSVIDEFVISLISTISLNEPRL